MLYKIILFCILTTSLIGEEIVYLKTPKLLRENIIGTNVGIRPFRKTGVRIESEWLNEKLIVHNYGYGGSGMTLSFGGALEVLEILGHHQISSKRVAILGGGVVGMALAYDLLLQGYEVHIYAEDWSPNLTSNVAAGIWSPLTYPNDLSSEKKQLHLRMLKNSEARFLKSLGDNPEFMGVRLITSYTFRSEQARPSPKTTQGEEIIAHFDNGVVKKGRRVYELGIDGKVFMDDLYKKVKEKGAILKQVHFETTNDLLNLEENIIVNCTSMGSIQLFKDEEFFPIRGQLVYYAPQKEMDYLYAHALDNDPKDSKMFFVSIYPRSDSLILGGVYEPNQTESTIDPRVIEKLINNAEKCLTGDL